MLRVARSDAHQRIQKRIEKGRELLAHDADNPAAAKWLKEEWERWTTYNEELAGAIFTDRSAQQLLYSYARVMGAVRTAADVKEDIEGSIRTLLSIQECLDITPESPEVRSGPAFVPVNVAVQGTERAGLERIERVFSRFHAVAKQIERRYDGRPTLRIDDEYDVQDLLHALLTVDFEDIRREDHVPIVAGGASRVDFVLKFSGFAIEAKNAGPSLLDRKLGEQMLVDVGRYSGRSDYHTLVFFIYDPAHDVANPAGLKADVEARSTPSLKVLVRFSPVR